MRCYDAITLPHAMFSSSFLRRHALSRCCLIIAITHFIAIASSIDAAAAPLFSRCHIDATRY